MAKATGPLQSLDAHGGVGGVLVFQSGKQGVRVRFDKKPRNPKTAAQQEVRDKVAELAYNWRNVLTAEQKQPYIDASVENRTTPFAEYTREQFAVLETAIWGTANWGTFVWGQYPEANWDDFYWNEAYWG